MRGEKNKDDILDILAYCYKVIAKYRWDIRLALEMILDETESSFSDTLQVDF